MGWLPFTYLGSIWLDCWSWFNVALAMVAPSKRLDDHALPFVNVAGVRQQKCAHGSTSNPFGHSRMPIAIVVMPYYWSITVNHHQLWSHWCTCTILGCHLSPVLNHNLTIIKLKYWIKEMWGVMLHRRLACQPCPNNPRRILRRLRMQVVVLPNHPAPNNDSRLSTATHWECVNSMQGSRTLGRRVEHLDEVLRYHRTDTTVTFSCHRKDIGNAQPHSSWYILIIL